MKSTSTTLIATLMMVGCAFTPPGQQVSTPAERDYGAYPSEYKSIVLDYLKEHPPQDSIESDSIYFLNAPDRYADRTYASSTTLYGYRVCIQGRTDGITKKSSQLHFFLINNNQVVKHASKTGLATYFDRQCSVGPQQAQATAPAPVAPASTAAPPADAAPANPRAIAAATAATAAVAAPAAPQVAEPARPGRAVTGAAVRPLKYIVCEVDDSEMLLIVDQDANELRREVEGADAGTLTIETLSDTSIVATDRKGRLFLSRVSGKLIYRSNGQKLVGRCESSDRTRY